MGRLQRSEFVRKLAWRSFQECDLDKSGAIDVKELHVGLLLVYDKLNKKLPVYLKPPSHNKVRELMGKHDWNSDGQLSFEEFHSCVMTVIGANEHAPFTESITFQAITRIVVKMAVLPLAVFLIKELVDEVGSSKAKKVVKKVPDAVLAGAVEGVGKVAVAAAGLALR